MGANPLLGVFLHWLGGLASASFYVPYRRVRGWSWETYWLTGGVMSWIVAPWLLAALLTRDLLSVLHSAPSSAIFWTYFFGVLWGLGGLTFGLTMRYLGLSLGMATALGYTAVFGTLVPPIFHGQFMQLLSQRSGVIDSFRSFATIKTYRGYIRKWIKPRWGFRYLDEVKAVDVEGWLRRLPIARSSRAKIRSILSILFNHACRSELFDRNPMRFVRQGAKRRGAPNVLTAAEIKALVDHLPLRERTLVLLAAATGLRQSELFGLKWRDVDVQRGELSVIRLIVFGVVGRCKTESSQKPVPLHRLLGEALLTWRKTCKSTGADDWVFASRLHKGRRPYWGASILRKYIRPVAAALNIQKRIGWHTFRHTYSTLLRSVGAEFKVMQELMRHSTLRATMDVYTQAVAPAKHAAQAAVPALFFPMTKSADDDAVLGTA